MNFKINVNHNNTPINHEDEDNFKIIITGDYCPIGRIEKLCKDAKYQAVYNDLLPILKDKDLSITNLECPITKKTNPIIKSGPNLVSHPDTINGIKFGGFDVVTLANNHIYDHSKSGLMDTLELCSLNDIKTVGAGENITEAQKPLIVNVRNCRVAILNFAEKEFGIASMNNAGANPLDVIPNYYQILKARKESDVIIVIIHGGQEYYNLPSPKLVNICRFFANLGVNAVVCHHTHTPSGYEVYNGVPIFYSLGNFIFDWQSPISLSWYEGYFVRLTFCNKLVRNIEIVPYFQNHYDAGLNKMDESSEHNFLNRIQEYSNIILDATLLNANWKEYCGTKRIDYISKILGSNKVIKQLMKRNIFTSFWARKTKSPILLNILRCESHRDVILENLEEIYQKIGRE